MKIPNNKPQNYKPNNNKGNFNPIKKKNSNEINKPENENMNNQILYQKADDIFLNILCSDCTIILNNDKKNSKNFLMK